MTTLAIELNKTLTNIKHNFAIKHCCENSRLYHQLMSLTWDQYCQLRMVVDDNDEISHICDEYFCVNRDGGSMGHRVDFYATI
jgi:hypothetical protein